MSGFEVEVVFALPEKQVLKTVFANPGATVADVVAESDLMGAFPGHVLTEMTFGIWGRVVEHNQAVKEGDRIEIYRPLELDPREARRHLALTGGTMSTPDSA